MFDCVVAVQPFPFSTFLQRLLSLDTQAHSFDLWKRIADPLSNRTKEDYSIETDAEFDQVKYLSPGGMGKAFQFHMMSADLPEEDIMVLYDSTPAMQDTPWQILPVRSAHFNNSMEQSNKAWAYLHFKRRLQMWSTHVNRFVTNDEAELKKMHWVLKGKAMIYLVIEIHLTVPNSANSCCFHENVSDRVS